MPRLGIGQWWDDNIDETGRQPLLVLLVAFTLTFLVVRLLTRLIRAGRGPFSNVAPGGVHIHHAVPGVVLLFAGGVLAVADIEFRGAGILAAVLVGVGGGLVFDEFALILHLDDVYWSEEGRQSIEVVTLLGALLLALLTGVVPFGVEEVGAGELRVRIGSMLHAMLAAGLTVVCVLKGKLRTAVWALFLVPVGVVGAVRLARPGSPWARRWYQDPAKRARADARLEANESRWGRIRRAIQDAMTGRPSDENTADEPPDRVPGSRR